MDSVLVRSTVCHAVDVVQVLVGLKSKVWEREMALSSEALVGFGDERKCFIFHFP